MQNLHALLKYQQHLQRSQGLLLCPPCTVYMCTRDQETVSKLRENITMSHTENFTLKMLRPKTQDQHIIKMTR